MKRKKGGETESYIHLHCVTEKKNMRGKKYKGRVENKKMKIKKVKAK